MFKSDKVVFRFERWNECGTEILAIAGNHFAEVEGDLVQVRPYKPKIDAYALMDQLGMLRLLAARDHDGQLVGYATWNLVEDIESAGLFIATQGAMYVKPGVRAGALLYSMIKYSIKCLERLGVRCLFLHHRLQGRGTRLDSVFRRLHAVEIKHEFMLMIGDKSCQV
jgi:hypothetical protein